MALEANIEQAEINQDQINNNTAQIQEPKEQSFLQSLWSSFKRNSPFNIWPLKPIWTLVSATIDYIKWTDTEREQIKTDMFKWFDKATWWFLSATSDLFTWNKDTELNEVEKKHTTEIEWFITNLDKNVIWTLWADKWSVLWVKPLSLIYDSSVKFKKWNQEELSLKINAIESEELPAELQTLKNAFDDKLANSLNIRVNEELKKELSNNLIAQDQFSVARRKKELIDKLYQEELNKNLNEKEQIDKRITEHKNKRRDELINEYVVPEEWSSASDTFLNQYSQNSSQRITQYIKENIVSWIVDNIIPKEQWDVISASDKWLESMKSNMEEVLIRDYKHYYENLWAVTDEKTRQRIKWLLLPQLEARQKYFSNIISDYQNSLSTYEWDINELDNDEKKELIMKAYDTSADRLSEDEKMALMTRDGTDTLIDMYYNTEEMKRRFEEWSTAWIALAAWNLLQIWVWALWGIVWAWISWIASTTFKTTDDKKIFYDEYELSTVYDNVAIKVMKHTAYNIDDLWELFVPNALLSKVNKAEKVISKWTSALKTISLELAKRWDDLTKTQKAIQYTNLWLRVWWYASKWAAEWFTANVIVNRQLRTANTDANAYLDIVWDVLLEPVFHSLWKQLWWSSSNIKEWITWWIQNNYLSQNAYSLAIWEKLASNAVKDLVTQAKLDWIDIKQSEWYSLIRQARDLILATTSKTATDIIKWDDLKLLYKNIIDNLPKLEKNAEVWANKMYTPEWTILKLDNLTTQKLNYSNEIDKALALKTSTDSVDSKLWEWLFNKLLDDNLKVIKWDIAFQDAFLKLNKEQIDTQTSKVSNMINLIKEAKSIDVQRKLMYDLNSYMTTLKNSNVPESKQTRSKITVFSPIYWQSVTVDLQRFKALMEMEWNDNIASDFEKKWIITINKERAVTLWITDRFQEWDYKVAATKTNFISEIKDTNKELFDFFIRWISPWKKWSWATGSETLSPNEIKAMLNPIFWNNISIEKLEWSGDRWSIVDIMKSDDTNISIRYWEQKDKLDPTQTNYIYYIGIWKKLIDKWFDVSWTYTDYHSKSSEILKDILSFKDIEEWINFARPLHNILNFKELTSWHKESIIEQQFKDAWLMDELWIYTKRWQDVKKLIYDNYVTDKEDTLATYWFEVFTSKVINNYELFKQVFADLKNIKEWTELTEKWILKTSNNLNDLINAFADKKVIKRSADKHRTQFNLNEYKKKAEDIYNELTEKQSNQIYVREQQIRDYENRITSDADKKIIDNNISQLRKEIDLIKSNTLSKEVFTKNFIDNIYNNTFARIIKQNFTEALSILEWVKSMKLNSASEMRAINKAIKDNKTKLEALKSIKTVWLNQTELNKLKNDLKDLSSSKKELESKLNKIVSDIEVEKDIIKWKFKLSKESKKIVESFLKRDSMTGQELYDTFKLLKNELEESFEFNNYMFNLMTTKLNSLTWELFSKESLKQVSDELLRWNIYKFVDNEMDFYFAQEENPILKVFSSVFKPHSENTEQDKWLQVFDNLLTKYKYDTTKEWNPSTISELYFKNEEFRNEIKWYIVSWKWSDSKELIQSRANKNFTKFRQFINELLSWVEYNLIKDWVKVDDATKNKTLFTKQMYSKLYKQFKSLNNKINTWTTLTKNAIYSEAWKLNFETWLNKDQIVDRVLIVDDLEKATDWRIRTIQISSVYNLDYMKTISWWKETKLSYYLSEKVDNKKKTEATYKSGKDSLVEIMDKVNNTFTYKKESEEYQQAMMYRDQLWLLDEDWEPTKEFIMWTFWDKESYLKIYNPKLKEWEKKSLNQIKQDFTREYIDVLWLKRNWKDIKASDINKRETALVSKESVFEDVKIKTNTYVLEKVNFWDEFVDKNWKVITTKDFMKWIKQNKIISMSDKSDLYSQISEDFSNNNSNNVQSYIDKLHELDETLWTQVDKYDNITDLKNYFETLYDTDLDDWTSFATKDIFDIYASLKWEDNHWTPKKWHMTWLVDVEWIKERMLWKTLFNQADDVKIFSWWTWNPVNKTIFLWESSAKLKWWYIDNLDWIKVKDKDWNEIDLLSISDKDTEVTYERKKYTAWRLIEILRWEKAKLVEINWEYYRTVWEFKWTDTSFFKDAATEAQAVKQEQTVTEQAVNLMRYDIRSAYEADVMLDIQKVFDETLWALWNYDFKLPSFWDVNIWLSNLQRKYQVWWSTDTVVFSRIKSFFDKVNQIISWSKTDWFSHLVLFNRIKLPSNNYKWKWLSKKYLNRNEVIVSNKSDLYISTKKKLQSRKEELDLLTELKQSEQDELDLINTQLDSWELIVTAIRNPIPNQENLWVFKLIQAEKVWYNKKDWSWIVSWESIITHPESNFIKFQWDNDGDHVVLFPVTTTKWKLLARTALNIWMDDNLEVLLKDWAYENKVAVISQIWWEKKFDKAWNEIIEEVKEFDIIDWAIKNLEAKVTVSNASSTIRWLNILLQYIDEYNNSKLSPFRQKQILATRIKWKEFWEFTNPEWFKTNSQDRIYTLEEIIKNISLEAPVVWSEIKSFLTKSDKYGGKVWSILQLVLDFAKDKTWKPFDKTWINKLLSEVWVKDKQKIAFLYNNILEPMWLTHKSWGKVLSVNKINQLFFHWKKWDKKANIKEDSEVLNSTMWFRRNMLDFISTKYAKNLANLKVSIEPRFLLAKEFKESWTQIKDALWLQSEWLYNKFKARIQNTTNFILENDKFLWPDVRRSIELLFNDISVDSPRIKKLIEKFDIAIWNNTHPNTWRINYHKTFLDLWAIDSKWNLLIDRETRNIYAMYSMKNWNNTMFNLLSENERLWLLRYSEDQLIGWRRWYTLSAYKFNPNYEATLYLSKIPERSDVLKQLDNDLKEVEDLLNDNEFDISYVTQEIQSWKQYEIDTLDINEELDINPTWLINALNELSVKKEQLKNIRKNIKSTQSSLTKNFENIEAKTAAKEDFNKVLTQKEIWETYLNKLDITYNIWKTEYKELSVNIKRMWDVETLLKQWVMTKMSDVLAKYMPDAIAKMNKARALFWNEARNIKRIYVDYHTKFEKEVKDKWLIKWSDKEYLKLLKWNVKQFYVQNKDWYFFDTDWYLADIEKKLAGKFNDKYLTDIEKELIRNSAIDFDKKILVHLADWLTRMDLYYKDQWWYKINYSSDLSKVFFDDLLQSFTWDLEFQFRRTWKLTKLWNYEDNFVSARKEFNTMFKEASQESWVRYNQNDVDKIFDITFYKKEDSIILKIMKELQAVDYFLKYQTWWALLWLTSHIAWITQIPWNAIEVISWTRRLWDTKDVNSIIDWLWLHWEDTFAVWQWLENDLSNTFARRFQKTISVWIKDSVDKIGWKFFSKDKLLLQKIWNAIDTWVTEPLFFVDWLIDIPRRQAAAQYVMDAYWVKNKKELSEILLTSADKDKFETLFYKKYNEMWWSVISSAPIYRENKLTVVNSQKSAYAVKKLFVWMYKYLNGWSISKITTMAEKAYMSIDAIKLYNRWDKVWAKQMMTEYINYTTSLMSNIAMAVWLAVKFEQYDRVDWDEEIDNWAFITNITNNLVSLEILFDREIENILWVEWDSFQNRMAVTTLELLKHVTRQMQIFKAPATIANRMETLDEWIFEATYNWLQSIVWTYMRNAHWLNIGNIYENNLQNDNIALFWYWMWDRLDKSISKIQQAKTSSKIDSIWYTGSMLDMFFNYFTAQYIWNEWIQKWVNKMLADENIRALYNDWISKNWYDLDLLMLTNWQLDNKYIEDLWNSMIVYQWVWTMFDASWRKIKADPEKLYNNQMDDIITKQLELIWYSKEDFLNRPKSRTEALQKLFYEVWQDKIPELSTQHLTAYIANNKYKEYQDAYKESIWITYSDKYNLWAEEQFLIKYRTLKDLEWSWILNANKLNLQVVSWLHVEKNDAELHKFLLDSRANSWLQDYMDWLLLSTQNLKDWDTNAKYLTSKYAKALKWINWFYSQSKWYVPASSDSVEMMTNATLTFIREIVNSSQPWKEQTAKIAAALTWLDTAWWNMLRDNEVFNLLTIPAQRQLMSWVYKAHNELDTYDANSVSNYPASATSSWKWKSFSNYFRKWMSSWYMSWARPWFWSQFPAIKEFVNSNPKSVPSNWNRIANDYLPQKNLQLNYLSFPIMRDINNYFIRETYRAITQPAQPKIKTKKWQTASSYIRTKQKKISLPSVKSPKKTYSKIRKTTMPWLPWDISAGQ